MLRSWLCYTLCWIISCELSTAERNFGQKRSAAEISFCDTPVIMLTLNHLLKCLPQLNLSKWLYYSKMVNKSNTIMQYECLTKYNSVVKYSYNKEDKLCLRRKQSFVQRNFTVYTLDFCGGITISTMKIIKSEYL